MEQILTSEKKRKLDNDDVSNEKKKTRLEKINIDHWKDFLSLIIDKNRMKVFLCSIHFSKF